MTEGDGAAEGGRGGPRLSHVRADGSARMVDVSHKPDTERSATASGTIRMQMATFELIQANGVSKGDVLGVARIAGYQAAKRTAELIPLCHPLPLTGIEIDIQADATLPGYRVTSTVRCTGRTGVEMEALTAVSICLLTVYDMAKGVDRAMEIGYIAVLSKNGGTSGPWQRA